MSKYKAKDIARWFLMRNQIEMNERDADYFSNMKLQKMLYYAQGAFLALTGEELFDEQLLAWTHGPVVESIYHEYKGWGSRGILFNRMPQRFREHAEIDTEDEAILESVYNEFAQYSAGKLRNMTHEETPWKEAQQRGTDIISNDTIKQYFIENYVSD